MIRTKVALPDFVKLRVLPEKARDQMRIELQTIVKPAVQKQVDETWGKQPGKVQYPFQFGTDKSRRAFFATNGFGQGIPTPRSNKLNTSWVVDISSQFIEDALRIYNNKSYAQYVYGSPTQRQIPGHARTGWLLYNDPEKVRVVKDVALRETYQAWGRAVLYVLHN